MVVLAGCMACFRRPVATGSRDVTQDACCLENESRDVGKAAWEESTASLPLTKLGAGSAPSVSEIEDSVMPTLGSIIWIGSQGTLHKAGEWSGQQVAVRVLRRRAPLPAGAIATALQTATALQHDHLVACLHLHERPAAPKAARLSVHDSVTSGISPEDSEPPSPATVCDLEPQKRGTPSTPSCATANPFHRPRPRRASLPATTTPAVPTHDPASSDADNPPLPTELWTILEYCNGGTLAKALTRRWQYQQDGFTLHLARVLVVLLGVARALQYLHQNARHHGKVAAGTVLLHTAPNTASPEPKLTFPPAERLLPPDCLGGGPPPGMSSLELQLQLAPSSSLGYCSPEALTTGQTTAASDIYSLGILMWEVAADARPFSGMKGSQIVSHVAHEGGRPMFPSHLPPLYVDLATSCWAQDPAARPPASQVVQRLEEMAQRAPQLQAEMEHSLGELRNMLAIIC